MQTLNFDTDSEECKRKICATPSVKKKTVSKGNKNYEDVLSRIEKNLL